ncbi:MAG: glycosyl transferase family 2, partial [Ilumatobacteraceae bacterium]|nr:glycosyl transferase family 2 [Ilumatobacteraceae bacterium]
LDPSIRRAGDGRVLLGGSPLTLMRLTAAGASLIDRLTSGEEPGTSPATATLIDRLLGGGLIHPVAGAAGGLSPGDVTVVIPAFATSASRLAELVDGCASAHEVIVVDDASPDPIGPVVGSTVIHRSANGGPGAARMTGLEVVTTPFVAFVDADVHATPGWLDGLLGHFADARVAMVAPRVASLPGSSRLARYEAVRSPLDLGASPARVRAGTRVSYVPAAAVVCRVEAVRAVGGFDDALRLGEDVDLAWRLDDAGWRVRYEPAVVVLHEPRATVAAMVSQRFGYGTSGAPLASRHPGALAPVRVSRWSALSWAATVAGCPVVGTAVAAVTTAMLARKLRDVPDGGRLAMRLAGLGHLYAGRSLASGITRAWWPAAAAAAIVSSRCRRALVLAAVVPAAIDWCRDRPSIDPASYLALRLLDDGSYGAGLLTGAVRQRSLEALRPDLTSWPAPARSRPTATPRSTGL